METTTLRGHAFAVLLLTLAPVLAWAAPGAPETKQAAPAQKVRQQLDQPISLDITDQSLSAALNQIREKAKINFVVDRLTIQQMGMDPDQLLVSAKLHEVKVRTALRSVLGPYNLGYAIIGDTVLISTDDVVMQRQLKQRVSIDLDKVDLATALRKLSKETAANVVLDSRVPAKSAKTEVSVQMDDVPLEAAVRLLAESAGLKPVKVGNVLMVTTKAVATAMRNDPDLNEGNLNINNLQQLKNVQAMQWLQLQQVQPNAMIWNGNFQAGGFAIGAFAPGQAPGAQPVPPLDKPGDKDDEPPADGGKPAPPDKNPNK